MLQLLMRSIGANEVEQEVTQRDQFDTDTVGLAETLVREAHQNSIDSPSQRAAGPVRTRVSFRAPSEDNTTFWRNLFEPLRPHLIASGIDISGIDMSRPSFLVIEDFETTGLLGAVDRKDDRNFSDFWRRTGLSHKRGQHGGRWGLGKLVYSSASRIRTFFGETIRDNDPSGRAYLMGQAVLKHHRVNGVDYAPHGFFGKAGDNKIQLPCTDPDLIAKFRALSGITRKQEPGLSIVIPFPQEDLTAQTILPHVIRNWFFPILMGKLVVEVGDVIVNENTFPQLATLHGGPSFQGGGLVSFISDLQRLSKTAPAHEALGTWVSTGIEKALPAGALEDLRTRYIQGDLVSLRVPITLRPKLGGGEKTHIDVYLRAHSDAGRSEALFVRGALTIPGEAKRFQGRACFGALLATDPAAAAFLGDAEGPAHTTWSGTAEKVRANWKNPGERLKEIRAALNQFYIAIAQPIEREDKNALIDIFNVRDESAKDQAPKRAEKIRRPEVPPISRKPAQYRLTSRTGGFALRGTPDTELPLQLRVRMAYDVVSGDPLKRYDPLDFNLVTSREIVIDQEGAVTGIEGPNILVVEAHSTSFAVSVVGFDSNRDLFVRVDRAS